MTHRRDCHLEIATQLITAALFSGSRRLGFTLVLQPNHSTGIFHVESTSTIHTASGRIGLHWTEYLPYCILVTQMAFVKTFKCSVELNMLILASVPTQAKQDASAPAWGT